MKIRHPLLIKAAGFTGALVVPLWMGTLGFRYRPLGPNLDPRPRGFRDRYIYAFWHEYLLLPAYLFRRSRIHVLISQHADGQMIAEVCRHLGYRTIRGSTTRGGVEALREMLRLARHHHHLGITPDGPRGPRRQVQPGLIYLASQAEIPVVPVGFAFDRPWRARSWDRFALPRPGSMGAAVTAAPIRIPAQINRAQMEQYRLQVERELLQLTEAAERLAEH